MVEPLGHRQTKEAGTRMLDLTPLRHIPTLPQADPEHGYQASDFIHYGGQTSTAWRLPYVVLIVM
jgi:hypothetical protein